MNNASFAWMNCKVAFLAEMPQRLCFKGFVYARAVPDWNNLHKANEKAGPAFDSNPWPQMS